MVAAVGAVALVGLRAQPVRVEAALGGGLPKFRVVGLPDAAVRESGDRIRSAVRRSAGVTWRQADVVVNLSPAALRKTGAGFDLPIALAVLAVLEQVPERTLTDLWALGELGLDGAVRAVPGVLPVAGAVRERCGRLLVAERGAVEAALVDGLEVVPVADLDEAAGVLRGEAPARAVPTPTPPPREIAPDLRDVRGQPVARRALEIAAAGGHHVLLVGPPGCGKSMLARRLPALLPPLSTDQALEVAAVHSICGQRDPDEPLSRVPPFRAPHHLTSAAGLVGGGTGVGRPGELSCAHHGVLFLDELLEMPRWVLDALRQPLEDGRVTITRSRATVRYPARVLLVAATNPCPCGHRGVAGRPCRCRPDQVERYRSRLSGPLLDRIDLQVALRPVGGEQLLGPPDGEDTATVAARVATARSRAARRWGAGALVRDAPVGEVRRVTTRAAVRRAVRAVEALGLSARAFDRCLRVARSIADLEGCGPTTADHVDEALAYRLGPG